MNSDAAITSVRFTNFKAFANFSISLDRMNILVGPNNSGKSTVIGAFRVLAMGLNIAARRNPEFFGGRHIDWGYRIPRASIPISLENAQTNYEGAEATVTFRLSNGNKLQLSFFSDDDCFLYPLTAGGERVRKAKFSRQFPISLLVVPVLGPVEHEESIVKKETVNKNLATHRASRNFRNYWYYYPDEFVDFQEQVTATWPGMEIGPPESDGQKLSMFCFEDTIARELYWTGYGFQVWCQLLSHIFRSQDRSMLIIDEPDIYLHANPQRQLLSILKASGPDVLVATHSSEIVTEADTNDILVIDKTQRSAKRVRSPEGIQSTLGSLGSTQIVTMSAIAQARRVLYVEGEDFKTLRRFARRLSLDELASGVGIAPFPLGGFPTIERINAVTMGVRESIGDSIVFGGIFDRDFRPNEEINELLERLQGKLTLCLILERKEIENYLLIPTALERTLARLIEDRARRNGESANAARPIADILEEITAPMKADVQSQFMAKRVEYLKHTGKDTSTINREAIEIFERDWDDAQLRLHIVQGKRVLSELSSRVQVEYKVTLTTARIIEQLHQSEIPWDLRQALRKIESFRCSAP